MTKAKASPAPEPAGRQPATVSLDTQLLGEVDRLAASWGTTRERLLETAVMRFVDEEVAAEHQDPEQWPEQHPYRDPSPEGQALDRATAEADRAFAAYIEVGTDAADRGEFVTQDEMEEWFASRIAARGRSAAAE